MQSDRPDTVEAFLCYRRIDGSDFCDWLYELIDGASYSDDANGNWLLSVFYDRQSASTADWRKVHFPSLQSADALIVVLTPGLIDSSLTMAMIAR